MRILLFPPAALQQAKAKILVFVKIVFVVDKLIY